MPAVIRIDTNRFVLATDAGVLDIHFCIV
jgi:hypothetical protein